MARLTESPQYGSEHEQGCIFLGCYDVDGFRYDLWHAEAGAGPEPEPTLIARYAEEQSRYSSGLVFGWIEGWPDHPLVEARRRAEALGLDVRRHYYETHSPGRIQR